MKNTKLITFLSLGILVLCAIQYAGCGSSPAQKAFDEGAKFVESGQYPDAIASFTKAIELNPKFDNAYYNRALLYEKTGKPDLAFGDYNKIIEIAPDYAQPYLGRAVILAKRGNADQAIADYNKALELDINFGQAYYNRAMLYYARQEYKKAWEDATKADQIGTKVSPNLMRELKEKASGRS